MDILSKQIIKLIGKDSSTEEKEIYTYGIQLFFSDISNFLVVIIPSLFINRIPEGIVFLSSFIAIRRNCGGYHCSTSLRCNTMFFILFMMSLCSFMFRGIVFDFIFICSALLILIKHVEPEMLSNKNNINFKKKTWFNIILIFLAVYSFAPSLLYVFKFTIVIICILLYIKREEGV